jgi:dCTP deaminase
MPIMPDSWIRKMAAEHGMIEPFVEAQRREGVISYGLSSYGYDARAADEFKIFTNVDNAIVDPKAFSEDGFVTRKGPVCIIPPNGKARSRSKSAIPPLCRPRSMPMKAFANSCS